MKSVYFIFALFLFLVSCKKGKTLEHDVSVQFITLSSSGVYPEGYFPVSNPTETPQYPSYAHDYSPEEISSRFNTKLNSYLNKNKIILQTDTADYVLQITSMNLIESLSSEAYIDSCTTGNPTAYVHYSNLSFTINASIYKQGMLVGSWEEKGKSCETVKSKTDACNAPKIRRIVRTTGWLIDQVAKELRVRVSKKLFELEG
jgi:hypothetical protein